MVAGHNWKNFPPRNRHQFAKVGPKTFMHSMYTYQKRSSNEQFGFRQNMELVGLRDQLLPYSRYHKICNQGGTITFVMWMQLSNPKLQSKLLFMVSHNSNLSHMSSARQKVVAWFDFLHKAEFEDWNNGKLQILGFVTYLLSV